MSIASEITRINNNIANAYTQCSNKGATMPATQNSANLANTISTISGGGGGTDYYNTTIDKTYSYSSGDQYWINMVKKIPALTIASGITSLAYTFYNYPLQTLAFDGIDCSNITNLESIFAYSNTSNSRIKTIDLANITNTDNVSSVRYIFIILSVVL